jgi:predicted RecB family nuclease
LPKNSENEAGTPQTHVVSNNELSEEHPRGEQLPNVSAPQRKQMNISKSKFVAGVQCLKRLYLQVHQPELAAAPDPAAEAIIEQGREVGMLARQLFPGGAEVDGSAGLEEAIWTTRELIANREIPAIFEGAFEHGGVLVKADILQRRKGDKWRLLEVKSTTDVKDHHLWDVGIQSRVLSRSGLNLSSVNVMHVDRSYVFQGGSIDPKQFFRIRTLNRQIAKLGGRLTAQLRSEFRILALPSTPDIAPGRHCAEPVRCEFFERCNLPRPEDHIGYLPRIHASAVEKLGGMGIASIRDIPDDFQLSENQRRACTSVQTRQPWFGPDLAKELEALKYPLRFMDFETVNPAIPRFAGMRPYDQLPFQWSVHVLRERGAEPQHYEFLATDVSDPRPEFAISLLGALGERGSIVVYNQQFESARLSELAASLPEFTERVKNIQSRLWDLLSLVRNHVYHPAFAGSYSLKAVLPALVPDMTYAGMQVADGRTAGIDWESLMRGDLDQAEREKTRKALLDYCGQDTLALVRLVEKLRMHHGGIDGARKTVRRRP